jgi:hypothetical protein
MGSENYGIFAFKRPTLSIELKKSPAKELNSQKHIAVARGVKRARIKFGRRPPKRNSVIVNSFVIIKVITCPSFPENPGVLGEELVFLISKRL